MDHWLELLGQSRTGETKGRRRGREMQYQILNSYAKCERENVKCISNCGCPTGKFEVGFFGEKITSRSLLGVKGG